MMYVIKNTRIGRTQSLLGSRKLPKFVVAACDERDLHVHCNQRAFAIKTAKRKKAGGFWRVKAKA